MHYAMINTASTYEDVRTVWLLRNLSLDDQLCLRDNKNVAFL